MVGISGLRTLAELNIKRCPKLRLELNLSSLNSLKRITIVECLSVYNITLPTTLIEITLQRCMKLQFIAGIGHLTKLRELHISECPVFEEMPVVCGLSCLERITIDGWGKFSYLHVTDCVILKAVRGNLDMGHLAQLWISDCPELEELPCFARLTCLVEIRIFRCRKLQQVTLPRTLKNLQLVACKELKSVSEISHLKNPVELIISQCGQLELELRLEAIDSLQTITFDGCGKIKSFQLNKCQNIKRVSSNFVVEWISISGCHELEELSIRNCRELSWVKEINIESCDKLQNITLPARLTNLIVQRCRHLQKIAGMDDLSKLTELEITECPEIELPFLAELSRLEIITINSSEKLHKIILPASVLKITVQRCKNLQMVEGTRSLTKLTDICIGECPELKELPIFAGMKFLEMIAIYSCEKLHNIILPTTLIKLTVQNLYRGSQMLTAIENLTELEELSICESSELEELPSFSRLSCLKIIVIDSCEKLHNIILPTTLIKLTVRRCRGLRMVAGIGNLTKLTDICIGECPELEELPILAGLRFLEMIAIYSCEKLHSIILPTTLIKLTVRRCRGLRMIAEIGYLTKITDICIGECPELKELPSLARLSCLKMIAIYSCEKLHNIILPTTLIKLTVQNLYRGSQTLTAVENLTELEELSICDSPELEELPSLARMSHLKMIVIDSCEKLHSIILPTTLIKLTVRRCRGLCMVAGIGNFTKLTDICIGECPELKELPSLARLSCLKMIAIYSCEKLHNIILPSTLVKLTVQNLYRGSQTLTAVENLTELEELSICESPELEELPSLARMSRLKMIVIDSCEKLHNIILPTTLIKLTVRRCRGLCMLAGISNLTKLTDICIGECPELKELPILAGLSCLEMIAIDSCEKLHNIILPTTLIKLTVRRCRGLCMLAGISNLTKLTDI
ncbi:hypothetical protein SUGI_0696650 [Cryptomeria japonica]|nr:hypothetical protein SUGI_0696650 [Cryptomeria japonica]